MIMESRVPDMYLRARNAVRYGKYSLTCVPQQPSGMVHQRLRPVELPSSKDTMMLYSLEAFTSWDFLSRFGAKRMP